MPRRLHSPDARGSGLRRSGDAPHPEECIDCDACVEPCPVDAIFAEDQLPDEWRRYIQINADYYLASR
jgi:ferredoxin